MRTLAAIALCCGALGCSPEQADTADTAVVPPDYLNVSADSVVLEGDGVLVEVAPQAGGRIASLKVGGRERLYTRAQTDANSWGNVLWPSPQTLWGWPPPPALDSEPYQVSITQDGVRLTSRADSTLGLVFEKNYTLIAQRRALKMDYRIRNVGDSEITLAPWEVTRLPAGGKVFFPKGETPYFTGDFAGLKFDEHQGISWYDYRAADIGPEHHKVMTDGEEGWLAYTAEDFLLVKVFDNVPAELMAPAEGEIELYADPTASFIELEQQGFLTTLQAGESLHWQVVWAFDTLPEGALRDDREQLVRRARHLAGQMTSAD